MLQADPFIQSPRNSQSLNRYSYVLNNPLSYTDPSGYFSIGGFIKKYWRVVVAAVATYVTWGAASGWAATFAWGSTMGTTATLTFAGGAFAGAIAGAVGGAILSGTLKGAFYGTLSGAALGGIGASGLNNTTKSLASGTAGGVTSELQGGKFGHGFLSAGVGFWSGLKFGGQPNFGKFVASSIAGGTISDITGGKFANGAVSAGLAYAVAAGAQSRAGNEPLEGIPVVENGDVAEVNIVGLDGPGFESGSKATLAAFEYYENAYMATGPNQELTGALVQVGDSTYFTSPVLSGLNNNISLKVVNAPKGALSAGVYHTHPGAGNLGFSIVDRQQVRRSGQPIYLRNGAGGIRSLTPGVPGLSGTSLCQNRTLCFAPHPDF